MLSVSIRAKVSAIQLLSLPTMAFAMALSASASALFKVITTSLK